MTDLKRLKTVMVNFQRNANTLTNEERQFLIDTLNESKLDNFSIMSIAMMLAPYLSVVESIDRRGYMCYEACVNNPLNSLKLVEAGVVSNMDQYFATIKSYILKLVQEGFINDYSKYARGTT